jgi:hypothetical protein
LTQKELFGFSRVKALYHKWIITRNAIIVKRYYLVFRSPTGLAAELSTKVACYGPAERDSPAPAVEHTASQTRVEDKTFVEDGMFVLKLL